MVRPTAAQQRVQPTPPPPPPAPAPQRRAGQAWGSQGYSVADCETLVDAVKAYLPLGRDEWTHVLNQYNWYATNGFDRSSRDLETLKIKFRALVNHTKPTVAIQTAQHTFVRPSMLKEIWTSVPTSLCVLMKVTMKHEESFGTITQPNDDQTRMVSMIPGLDSYGNDDDEEGGGGDQALYPGKHPIN
ncbi:hypothetical protein Pst134EA_026887 [Puccinia striiformis f. sp. tritici]|uniref:hypothetical protein n=1 Tax=Puccinia striiformis f. sp. tritici TaxID=168172 RepID=UPI002007F6B3|nr:hypothetical protein Pst134EA_026887 [Puccinia striiformis f. sp. tritici]KAH9450178.1 hypothetical protein Pst134EA_026887 [Puccinia striiformis f. sp. tritici]